MIVDRLFAAAELRFGAGKNQKRVRIVRTDGVKSSRSWMRGPVRLASDVSEQTGGSHHERQMGPGRKRPGTGE